MIRIYQEKDYEAMSRRAAGIIAAEVIRKPDCVLGLATGSSPVGTYKELIAKNQRGELSFEEVCTVNLDEYKGLAPDHDQSYRYFMQTNLFDHIDIDKENTFVPDGLAEDAEDECARYDALVYALGGTDLQLLGLGRNGHIGFNEPCDEFVGPTHVVTLTENTIKDNSRFFASADEVPRKAVSMGIGTIMNAKKIVLVASGANKADAVKAALEGPVVPSMPASILQFHKDVTFVIDKAAAAKLEFFKEV
ncbi:MAG: glucosamine-6-phosphate deaminase [Oscillospiraceae bacterium]|nr:glucosamine-6-phosphate deaminase [Oscillospiraceae bacterium]